MKKRIKILHYLPNLVNGGIESMLLNYYEYLKDDFSFVVVIHGTPEAGCLKRFQNCGIKVYQISHWTNGLFLHHRELKKIILEEEPDIFQTHHNLNNFIPCFTAKLAKIRIRISHCHNYLPKKNLKQKFYSFLSRIFATDLSACGLGAATFLTNSKMVSQNKVQIIYNAVDVSTFQFQPKIRNQIRKKYHWDHCIVYGNVGRFAKQKNQMFLIDLFEKISQIQKEARFLMIGGSGTEYPIIKKAIETSSISDKIVLLKDISNVCDFYQAMDCFLLPSFFEGFAVTLIEAQMSHLPCIISDTITKEFENEYIYSLPLCVSTWVDQIKNLKIENRDKLIDQKILERFDISLASNHLKKYYFDLIKSRC